MSELVHLPADTTAELLVEVLQRDGGVIVDNVLNAQQLETLKAEIMPYVALCKDGRDDFSGKQTRRVGALMARSPACGEMALHPLINAACAQYLAPFCDGYQLHFSQVVSIGEGEGRQQLHKDRYVWGGYVPEQIETQFSTIWAVSDFTEENGATQVVPGSHLWDKKRRPQAEEITYAAMSAGSVFIYSGSTIHGGGANLTKQNRVGALLHYTLNWLRQEENQYLSCPPAVAQRLPEDLRALVGYARGGPVLGFFTPPVGPGEGLELLSPERIFGDSQTQVEPLFK